MYAAPKIYENVVVPECNIDMYKMNPIHADTLAQTPSSSEVQDLETKQDMCLAELAKLQQKLDLIETECCSVVQEKVDMVVGCSVGSPAVYMTAIVARKLNSLIKVYSHSSNTRDVDSSLTDKLTRVNAGESDHCGMCLIYKDVPAPYFIAKPGRQVAVHGMSNILRYLARSAGMGSLYNEVDLELAAQVDEMLAMVDKLELQITSGQGDVGSSLNIIAGHVKGGGFLAGSTFSIADIALCSCLTALGSKAIPNSLKPYLLSCVTGQYEMRVLKAFLDRVVYNRVN